MPKSPTFESPAPMTGYSGSKEFDFSPPLENSHKRSSLASLNESIKSIEEETKKVKGLRKRLSVNY
jgi:hypothetical protein